MVFFDPGLMDRLNDTILQHYSANSKNSHWKEDFVRKSATEVVPWFPFLEGNTEFEVIENDARLTSLTEAVLGEGWQVLYLTIMYSKKGTKRQSWHQDCPPEKREHFNLKRLIYTHDINEETGGQVVIFPKTHRRGAIPQGNPHGDLEGQVVLCPKKRTLLILHGHCWHRVLPIKSEFRISTNARAIPSQVPEDITDIAVYRNMRYRFSTSEVIEDYEQH